MAKLQLFPRPGLVERVSMTQLRPHLREVVAVLGTHGTRFLITHHGRQVAALVSVADFWRIWEDEELELYGPKNPETGRRPGGQWVAATGWKKGMAVRWTEAGPMVLKDEVMAIPLEEGEAVEEGEKGPEVKRRAWWKWW